MSKELKHSIAKSDKRIAAALAVLQSHNRGLNSLCDFKRLGKGMASGLDSQGLEALVTLLTEFTGGRRDFLDTIKDVVLPPHARVDPQVLTAVEWGFRSCEKGDNLDATLLNFQKTAHPVGS